MRILLTIFFIGVFGVKGQIINASAPYRPLGGTLLLDLYPGASAAYSLRLLNTSYTGNCIRVRRSSDNTEQNIGFVGGIIDSASLKTFCSGTTCFVTTWYDQSGNINNATQSTAGNQPRIYNAGAIEKQNGEYCIRWSSNAMRLSSFKFAAPSTNWNIITIASINNASGNNNNALGTDGNGFQSNGIYLQVSSCNFNRNGGYIGNIIGTMQNNSQTFLSHQYFSTDSAQSYFNNSISNKNSMLISGLTFTNGDQSVYWIGAYRSSNTFNTGISLLGSIQEHIVYKSDQTNNMSGIKSNINSYYSIW